jgi:hypothetical protein
MLLEGVYSLLTGSALVTSLVGTPNSRPDGTTGIFPVQLPEATPLPSIAIVQIAGLGDVTMDGPSGLRSARVQFSCYGHSYCASKRLAVAVRAVLEGMHQTLPEGTQVDVALPLLESDTFEEAPFVYHTPLDFQFWFREPAATG